MYEVILFFWRKFPERIKKPFRKMYRHWMKHLRIKSEDQMLKWEGSGVTGYILLDPYQNSDKKLGSLQYYSQFYQDMYLDTVVFKKKTGGVYLDVGGNDPVRINNTYFFEKNRGWNGLAFEPMNSLADKWKAVRKTECIRTALGDHKGTMQFVEYEDHYMSGFQNKVDYTGKVEERYRVPVVPLGDILRERNLRYIDFMSLDVEGAELEVLRGIDWNRVHIYCIIVENNRGKKKEREIREYLRDKGYELRARLWIDDVWIKKFRNKNGK